MVIGCAGSGKSTLARQLAGRTGLPLVERDGLGVEGSPGYLSAVAEMAARPAHTGRRACQRCGIPNIQSGGRGSRTLTGTAKGWR